MSFLRRNATIIILFVLFVVLLSCQLDYLGMLTGSPTATPTRAPTRTPLPPSTSAPTVVLMPTLPPPSPPPAQITAAATDNVRIRATPSTAGAILGRMNQGETALATGRTAANDWVQIALAANPSQRGWVAAEFVRLTAPIEQLPVVQSTGPSPLPTTRPGPLPTTRPYP